MHGGIEWFVDGHECVPAKLRDRAEVLGLLDRIVAAMDLHVVSTAVHVFPGAGRITALYLLSESHLTIHTFPEAGTATLNAYCCRPQVPAPWRELAGELLGAGGVTAAEHVRGLSRDGRFRSAVEQGSESPYGEGLPERGRR